MSFTPINCVTPAMTNTERQRRFRERNPGYYGRLHRKRTAATNASVAAQLASVAAVVVREPLALPAPVETIRIPGVNVIPTPQELFALRQLQAALADRAAA